MNLWSYPLSVTMPCLVQGKSSATTPRVPTIVDICEHDENRLPGSMAARGSLRLREAADSRMPQRRRCQQSTVGGAVDSVSHVDDPTDARSAAHRFFASCVPTLLLGCRAAIRKPAFVMARRALSFKRAALAIRKLQNGLHCMSFTKEAAEPVGPHGGAVCYSRTPHR